MLSLFNDKGAKKLLHLSVNPLDYTLILRSPYLSIFIQ